MSDTETIREALERLHYDDIEAQIYEHAAQSTAALAALGRVEEREAEMAAVLEPFADPYNWHHNYDGHGVIFQVGHGTAETERILDRAKLLGRALSSAAGSDEQERTEMERTGEAYPIPETIREERRPPHVRDESWFSPASAGSTERKA